MHIKGSFLLAEGSGRPAVLRVLFLTTRRLHSRFPSSRVRSATGRRSETEQVSEDQRGHFDRRPETGWVSKDCVDQFIIVPCRPLLEAMDMAHHKSQLDVMLEAACQNRAVHKARSLKLSSISPRKCQQPVQQHHPESCVVEKQPGCSSLRALRGVPWSRLLQSTEVG